MDKGRENYGDDRMMTIDGVKMPRRATTGSAGYDFFAPDTYELKPGEWTMIDTGVRLTDDDVAQVSEIVRISEYAGKGKWRLTGVARCSTRRAGHDYLCLVMPVETERAIIETMRDFC